MGVEGTTVGAAESCQGPSSQPVRAAWRGLELLQQLQIGHCRSCPAVCACRGLGQSLTYLHTGVCTKTQVCAHAHTRLCTGVCIYMFMCMHVYIHVCVFYEYMYKMLGYRSMFVSV